MKLPSIQGTDTLSLIAAPMVNQSDLPFRLLTRKYGASLTYSQMLVPERLLNDRDYLEFHQCDLGSHADASSLERPVVTQLCGNDPDVVVAASRKLLGYCDAIDLNLGCPQEAAKEGHFGAYLLGQTDWPLVEDIVSAMSHSLNVPVSAKLRLCQPTSKTPELAERLEAAGASWITLHARHVSSRRRRQGAADLEQVRMIKERLRVPVISNGNVRTWEDVIENRKSTGADGIMVGETLLGNPCLFAGIIPDPVQISLEYLDLCQKHIGIVPFMNIQTHIRHFIDFQCGRKPWFNKFRSVLSQCTTFDELDMLLRVKVSRWRGKSIIAAKGEGDEDIHAQHGWEADSSFVDLFRT